MSGGFRVPVHADGSPITVDDVRKAAQKKRERVEKERAEERRAKVMGTPRSVWADRLQKAIRGACFPDPVDHGDYSLYLEDGERDGAGDIRARLEKDGSVTAIFVANRYAALSKETETVLARVRIQPDGEPVKTPAGHRPMKLSKKNLADVAKAEKSVEYGDLYDYLHRVGDDTTKSEIEQALLQVLDPATFCKVVAVFAVATSEDI